jgi:hypothetical protein
VQAIFDSRHLEPVIPQSGGIHLSERSIILDDQNGRAARRGGHAKI